MRRSSTGERRAPAGVLLALLVIGAWPGPAGASVKVERGDGGLTVAARDAPLEDVLEALAAEEGFEVRMQRGLERRPVDLEVHGASLDGVLRRLLSRRNYTIAYEETRDGLAVSRVTVLLPREGELPAPDETPQVRAVRPVRRPATTEARQRAAVVAAQRAAAERERRDEERREAVRKYREKQAQLLAERREALRREQARQATAEQVPLRRLLWSRGR